MSLGVLDFLIKSGTFTASEIAYIKPCTQCTDATLVARYCTDNGIASVPMGPVLFYEGFTKEFLDGQHTTEGLKQKIRESVDALYEGKKFIVVDGIGYPGVGSVVGLSNADVAAFLGLPVLLVGRPGVGDAIDSCNQSRTFFASYGVRVLGVVFNKVPVNDEKHTLAEVREYIPKFYAPLAPGFQVFGIVSRGDISELDAEAP
jgi:dethiobiotin synthetase